MSAIVMSRAVRPLPWRTIGVVALLVLTIVAVAFIAGSQRRLPPPFGPAGNGHLVLAEGGDIFLIDSATGAKSVAFEGPAVDFEPFFSRDGTRIAFFREVDGVRSLWLADDRGNALRELSTAGLVDFSQIVWSPDGKSILLTTIVVGKPAPVIVPTDGSPAHVINIDMPAENPIWLPGGQEIVFRGVPATGFGLFAIRPDGTALRTIVPATGANEYDALYFNASPDGSQIAYQWGDASGTHRIYVVPSTGGSARAITSVESGLPVWSPDGTWIAFFSDPGQYIVRADGTTPERRVMPVNGDVRWAPDASRLLYVAGDQSSTEQVLLDPRGGPPETALWSSLSLPDWQRLAPTP